MPKSPVLLIKEINVYATPMKYGKRHEKDAKAKYLLRFPSRHIHECRLVVNNELSFLVPSQMGRCVTVDHLVF